MEEDGGDKEVSEVVDCAALTNFSILTRQVVLIVMSSSVNKHTLPHLQVVCYYNNYCSLGPVLNFFKTRLWQCADVQ